MGWASLAGCSSEDASAFVGGRSCLEQGHTDSLGPVCAREHTHAHILGPMVLPSPAQDMTHPTLWLRWVGTISVAVSGAVWPWIIPGLFPRASQQQLSY